MTSPAIPAAPQTAWEWLEEKLNRQQFLLKAGWAFFYLFLGGWALSNLRYLFPNVLYEPSLTFKAGKPEEYAVGVSDKLKKAQRVWIVRTIEGFYCIWARCTHLGCTPSWFDSEQRFKCPCHGSNYNINGDVLAGPAPKPLWRCAISLGDDGQLFVDKGKLENRPGQRENGEFFLPVKS